MMTVSGQLLTLEEGHPTLADIALGLSRMPRFGGQTLKPYSVAHHSITVCEMSFLDEFVQFAGPLCELPLHALFHDAHEMMTGDIPTTFKTCDMKRLQGELDRRIYAGLGLPFPRPLHQKIVCDFDRAALLAEAFVLTPRATYERIATEMDASAGVGFIQIVRRVSALDAHAARRRFAQLANRLILKWGPQ